MSRYGRRVTVGDGFEIRPQIQSDRRFGVDDDDAAGDGFEACSRMS